MKDEHYDPGDHRPHNPHQNSVGGLFIARERGAFITPHNINKQDIPYLKLIAVVEGRVLWGHGSKLLDGLAPIHGAELKVTFTNKDYVLINNHAARIFHRMAAKFVLVLWDKGSRKVALRPIIEKDSRAYKLTYTTYQNNDQPNGTKFWARSFLNHIKWNAQEKKTILATWNNEQQIMEFILPEDCLADDNVSRWLWHNEINT